jgi:hypothetical protein
MTASVFLWQQAYQRCPFQEYFFRVGKELVVESRAGQEDAQYVVLFNRLLLYEVEHSHLEFVQCCLREYPYCKELYLRMMEASGEEGRREVVGLLRQKNLRVLQPRLLE